MSEEEKKAMETIKINIELLQENINIETTDEFSRLNCKRDLQAILNLIEKQEKVIDYMVDRIEWLMKSNGIVLDFEHKDNFTKEDIKDAFYRKVENK